MIPPKMSHIRKIILQGQSGLPLLILVLSALDCAVLWQMGEICGLSLEFVIKGQKETDWKEMTRF